MKHIFFSILLIVSTAIQLFSQPINIQLNNLNPSPRFWDNNTKIGINERNPIAKLHINKEDNCARYDIWDPQPYPSNTYDCSPDIRISGKREKFVPAPIGCVMCLQGYVTENMDYDISGNQNLLFSVVTPDDLRNQTKTDMVSMDENRVEVLVPELKTKSLRIASGNSPGGWQTSDLIFNHSLRLGSDLNEYAHNVLALKPLGATQGVLHTMIQSFRTDGPNNSTEIFRIHSGDKSWINNGFNFGIGTTDPQAKLHVNGTFIVTDGNTVNLKVTQAGKIFARDVEVKIGTFPDYVFNESYDLKPIEQVKKYIEDEKHLPNIPSAKEIEANGIGLGELAKKQMEKIEELTLYIIHLNDRINKLEKN
jgi:hypothetical protein